MSTPVYQDWSGDVTGQGVGSKRCKCNCGGFGYQTSMLYVMFPGLGGGGKPGADTGFEVGGRRSKTHPI